MRQIRAFLIIILVLLCIRSCEEGITPGPDPTPDVGSNRVLLMMDVDKNDDLPTLVNDSMMSVALDEFCKQQDVAFMRVDVNGEDTHLDDEWVAMIEAGKKQSLPVFILAHSRKKSKVINPPWDVDALLKVMSDQYK